MAIAVELGGYGGTGGINFVVDASGLHMQKISGAGAYGGANMGFTLSVEGTNADSAYDLEGFGWQGGGSAGEGLYGEAGAFGGESYGGVYGGVGIGGGLTPWAGFGFGTYTWGTQTLFKWNALWNWIPSLWDSAAYDLWDPC